MSYIYVGSPYSHPDQEVEAVRFREVCDYVHYLVRFTQHLPVSPIIHCHELSRFYSLPGDALYWEKWNLALLRNSIALHVLNIPGAAESKGLRREIAFACENNIGIYLAEREKPDPIEMTMLGMRFSRGDEARDHYSIRQTDIRELASVLRRMDLV